MATVIVKQEVTRTLILDGEESLYLKNLVQNYLGEGNEPPEYSAMRLKLFNCLDRDIEGEATYK
jgi:hypothetical protein